MSTQRFLVPVDGSRFSMAAAQYAVNLVRRLSGEIILLHCHKPFPITLGEPYFQRAITKIAEKSEALLLPYRDLMRRSELPFEFRILEGPAAEKIVSVAALEHCEMIVMGSRGRSDLQGLLLGSVTHRVLHSAPCPVLVIREAV
ncbi:MAG: universal stress protein [Desulfosarcinaceae bacterium]|nr:universal stress protein [Desulfosarcinaceae bacterium]